MVRVQGTFRELAAVLATVALGSSVAGSAFAQELRYQWQPGQKFSYNVEITVDSDESTTTYKGITHYTVDAAGAEQMRLTYRGGLAESSKAKQARRGPGAFPPFGPGGPRGIPSPFSRPAFAGKTQTTNQITITPVGNVLAMEGDSQLPYLLGNVSLLPFEALPEGNQREWNVDSGVSISQKNENRRGRFGPFDPFGEQDKENVQAAGEVTRYAIQGTSEGLIKVSRSYQLTMPEASDRPSFTMTGSGTWTFDSREHIPHALEMKYELTAKKGNSTTTNPITVKYTRISAEELARMEAAARQAAEEKAQAAAVAKAAAEAPLTTNEKQAALAALASTQVAQIKAKLGELAAKTPQNPDPEIVVAITQHLKNKDKDVAQAADKALVNWSAEHKLKKRLAKDYQGPGALGSTDRVVESTTPLYVGQLVQAQRKNHGPFWRAAKIEELLPDGTVRVGFLTWGKVDHSEVLQRRNIQLAPEELEQPDRPQSAEVASTEVRTWTDASGRFTIEAVLVSVSDGKANLRRKSDDRMIAVPVDKLSAPDQAIIKKWQNSENPFAVP